MEEQKRQILNDLDYIASQNRTLNLFTNFRGIPIHIVAGIIRCSHTTGVVRLRVPNHQISSLKVDDKILVQSDLFRSKLVGVINHIDSHTTIITLEGIRYVTGSMGNRENLRVQPENPIHLEIIMGHGFRVLGELIDISQGGLSIKLTKNNFPEDNLYILQIPVEIRFGLPVNLPVSGKCTIHDSSVQAIIAYANESQQTYRLGLLTSLKEPDLRVLRRYIFDRQTEILSEIQQMNRVLPEVV